MHFLYLLVSRFSLAYCRAVCFSALVIIFSLLDAVFLYYRDIFSVTKLTYPFQLATGGASYYIAISHILTLVEKYINICHEFCFASVLIVFLVSVRGCYSVTVDFDLFSGRTCIFILLDEQRHLLGHF